MGISDFFNPPKPIAYGPRVYLRPPWRGDQGEWLGLRSQSRVFLQPWEPLWHEDAVSIIGFKRWLDFAQHGLKTMSDIPLLIFSHQHRMLGGVTLKEIRMGATQSLGLGYWMGVNTAGYEYMVEAIAAIGLYCFRKMGVNRIEAACMPRNLRSSRVLEKLHFQYEGYLRELYCINGVWEDHHLYAMLNRDQDYLKNTLISFNRKHKHSLTARK